MAKNSEPLDLFGEPMAEPRDARGRKAYKRNPQVAQKIALSRAMGRTIEEIGLLIGMSPKTMTKYYSRELEQASELVEAVLDEAIFEAAIKEKRVGAQRLLRERLDKGKAAVPLAPTKAAAGRRPAAPRAPKKDALGKKAQALEDAKNAHEGTKWGELLN